jgi:methylglutaconyl-CoA hydratase
MAYQTLNMTHEGSVAKITFSRPEKRNAISYRLIDEFLQALGEVEKSDSRVLTVTGAGKAFCAGMDLDELKALTGRTPEQNRQDSETMALLFRSIYEFPKPTIAAVNGAAIAGGCGIATLCDFTIASREAKFGYTEVKIGFLPAIVSTFLVQQVGEKVARDLLLTGRIIDADEAHRIGLVTEVVEPEQLADRTRELASQLLENSPTSLFATKQLLAGFVFDELNDRVRIATDANARIRQTADFKEGISSFLEKRKPKWSGK